MIWTRVAIDLRVTRSCGPEPRGGPPRRIPPDREVPPAISAASLTLVGLGRAERSSRPVSVGRFAFDTQRHRSRIVLKAYTRSVDAVVTNKQDGDALSSNDAAWLGAIAGASAASPRLGGFSEWSMPSSKCHGAVSSARW